MRVSLVKSLCGRSMMVVLTSCGTIALSGWQPLGAAATPSTRTAELVGHKSPANANFVGTWDIVDPNAPEKTATLIVTDENDSTGTFSGEITPTGGVTPAFSAPFPLLDGSVTGDKVTFTIERTGIGRFRNATYRAVWTGTIADNTASGSIDASLEPPTIGRSDTWALADAFTGSRKEYVVSGKVELGCDGAGSGGCSAATLPVEGFEVDLTGDSQSLTSTTDDQGQWKVTVPPGSYAITPTDPVFTFSPTSLDVNVTNSDVTDQGFQACGAGSPADARFSDYRYLNSGQAYTYSLVGSTGGNCPATKFAVKYNPSGNGKVSNSWQTLTMQCENQELQQFLLKLENYEKVKIPYRHAHNSKNGAGIVIHEKVDSNIRGTILNVTIKSGYNSGTAVLNGQPLKASTLTKDGFDECYPTSVTLALNPAP